MVGGLGEKIRLQQSSKKGSAYYVDSPLANVICWRSLASVTEEAGKGLS